MTGLTLSHFEILEKLGEGGMGVVYKARDTQLGRIVAVKALLAEKVADADRRKRFVQEARAASGLNHPNIVTIHEIFQAQGTEFIVMEFVAGKTLDQLITRRGLRVPEALKYSVPIADALAKAHAAGIVHRDLKPANIMIADDGRVKILDFGLAKLTEPVSDSNESQTTQTTFMDSAPHTEDGTVIGTVAYMSPEQAEGRTVDARSDIFSFGAVLYEMLAGHRAFQGPSKMATLASVLREEPRPLAEIAPSVPRELEKLVARCLRKDPERRAQHMSDLKLALDELKEESESGQLSTAVRVANKRPRARIAGLVGLIVAVLAAGTVLLTRDKPAAAPAMEAVVLTSYPGVEHDPALSPDGKQVAFSWDGDAGGNLDLYVKLVDAGTPVRLTQTPQEEYGATWSPDGRFLAFVRSGRVEEPDGQGGGYYVMPALGGSERKLADIPRILNHARPMRADWGPDGKALIITDTSVDPPALALVSIETGDKIPFSAPPPKALGDFLPMVSPDGRWVAFVRVANVNASDWFLVPFSSDGRQEPRQLTSLKTLIASGTWTPKSTELVFSALVEGIRRLLRVSIDGSSPPSRITEAGIDVFAPSLARQGGRLVYEYRYGDTNLWRVDLQDPRSEPIRVFGSTKREMQPDFSADGTKLTFISYSSGDGEVWTANADGSNAVQVTHDGARPLSPRWSPDGRRLAFAKRPGGNVDVYVVDAQGGAPKRLTTDPATEASAYWSRDGKWIYFTSNRTGQFDVWKIVADGSAPEIQVTKSGGWRSRESDDGRTLHYQKFEAPGVFRMPVTGGPEQKVADSPVQAAWDSNGREMYYLDSGQALHRIDVASGRVDVVRTFDRISGGTDNFTISPDGRWLVYVRLDQRVNDLMLIESFR